MIVVIFLVESHLHGEKSSKAIAYDICITTEWSDQGNLIRSELGQILYKYIMNWEVISTDDSEKGIRKIKFCQ